jgi:iron complex outermembrane receptor protein
MRIHPGYFYRLMAVTTASAIAVAAAPAARAQESSTEEPERARTRSEEVVVTGTRIRGVEPVGAAVIPVDREAIEKSGVTNAADLLRKIPQVLSFGGNQRQAGGRSFQGAELNTTAANAPNLRGLGTASTLSLVNNHRVPPMGANMQLFDSETIPMIAMERLEVVADGASAIYGSDAISGVVNYIMRRPFDGAEVSVRGGNVDGADEWDLQLMLGQEWGSGGVMIAGSRTHRDGLLAAERPDLYSDDYSRFGGPPSNSTGYPGNVLYNGVSYGIPAGRAGTLSLANLSTNVNRLNVWDKAYAVPQADIDNIAAQFNQTFLDRFELYGDFIYSNRDLRTRSPRQGLTLTVPDTNPYSPCNASHAPFTNANGITCSGSLQVQYNLNGDLGATRIVGYEKVYQTFGGLKVDLPKSWTVDVSVARGHSENRSGGTNNQNDARLAAVLAGTVGAGPTAIPAFNPFCDGTAGCNSATTLGYITAYSVTGYDFDRDYYSVDLGGPLFSMWGGDWRLAVGAERYTDTFVNLFGNDATPAGTGFLIKTVSPDRDVEAAYGELYVPLISDANAVPFAKSLELSLAWRFEDYSDFGKTNNPKIGINWRPTDADVRVHASYGTSFRAPSLADNNPASTAAIIPRPLFGGTITRAGYTGGAGFQTTLAVVGGNSHLEPEEATTWTIGADWRPENVPGLLLSATYYDVEYTDKIDYPAWNAGPAAAINTLAYSPFVALNPTYFSTSPLTQAQFDALFNALNTGGLAPEIAGQATPYDQAMRPNFSGINNPASVIAIIDGRRNNTGVVNTNGIDLSANYTMGMDWGAMRFGLQGNYVFSYETAALASLPLQDLINKFSYPLTFRARGEVGVDFGRLSATAFINYTNSYEIEPVYSAVASRTDIDALTTVDMSIVYRTEDGATWDPAKNVTFVLGVQNLFDADPPLVLNNSSPGIMFDNAYASPMGRMASFQVSKRF